jgi:hypothetical protein
MELTTKIKKWYTVQIRHQQSDEVLVVGVYFADSEDSAVQECMWEHTPILRYGEKYNIEVFEHEHLKDSC